MRRVPVSFLLGLMCSLGVLLNLAGAEVARADFCPGGPLVSPLPTLSPSNSQNVGTLLTVNDPDGNWSANPGTGCGLPVTPRQYQWLSDGVAIFGATSTAYRVTSAEQGTLVTVQVTACDTFNFCTTVVSSNGAAIVGPASPILASPRSGEVFRDAIPQTSPPPSPSFTLKIASNLGCDVAFEVAKEPTFASATIYTEPSPATSHDYSPPTGGPDPGVYFWRAQFFGAGSCATAWSPASSFSVDSNPLGTPGDEPLLSAAGVSVNEATGNLVLSAPTPTYTSTSGSLSASVTYNSRDLTAAPSLGDGWSVGFGDSGAAVPLRLVDHSPTFDAIEVVYARAGSRWFAHVRSGSGGTDRYDAPAGETGRLVKDAAGTFTLSDDDGSAITFTPSTVSGTYVPQSAVLPVSRGSAAKLTYGFDNPTPPTPQRITSISDSATTPARTLNFIWSGFTGGCQDPAGNPVLLCITGPDPGIAYRYISNSAWTTPHLYRVIRANAATGKDRVLVEYGYNPLPATGAGLLQSIRSANDVNSPNDPNVPRSSAFAWNAAHQVTITHDSSVHVTQITESPVTTDSGTQTMTWTLDYTCTGLTLDGPAAGNPHSQPSGIARPAAIMAGNRFPGCTKVRGPNQQPSGAQQSVIYDRLYHPLEQTDELGRHTLVQYDERNLVLWTEDTYSYPTDYTYDPATHVLTTIQAPGPDPANVQANRPTTHYAYDEAVRDPDGSASPGTAKTLYGLQAAFYGGTDLADSPIQRRTEQPLSPGTDLINTSWDAAHLTFGASTIVPSDAYSVRWSGYLQADTAGVYGFHINGDGKLRLWIDQALVLDAWTSGGVRDVPVGQGTDGEQDLPLAAGRHSIQLEYAHDAGNPDNPSSVGQTHLLWKTPGAPTLTAIPLSSATPGWLNQTSVTSPAGLMTSSHYTEPWRGLADYTTVVSSDTSGGAKQDHITTMQYDAYGRLTSRTLPKGNDPTGAGACTIDSTTGALSGSNCNALEFTTSYKYWTPGLLASKPAPAAPSGCTVSPTAIVDTTGQLFEVKQNTTTSPPSPTAPADTWYDSSGRPVLERRGAGVWCMQYNDEGRLSVQYAPGEVTVGSISAPQRRTFTYDPSGALRTVTGGGTKQANPDTLTFEYDEAGRLRKATNALTAQSQYGYDADSNVTTRRAYQGTFPSGSNYTTTYIYDAADQLTQQTDPAARVYKFGYDQRGELVWTWYPNSTLSWSRANPDAQTIDTYARPCPAPTGTCGGLASAPVTPSSDPPGTATADFADWHYTRDPDGTITQETRTGASLTSTSNAYTYDGSARLTSATTSGGASATRTWGYDLDSNRISDTLGAATTTYAYASTSTAGWPDALFSTTAGATKTCYTYDSDGRQTSKRTYSGTGACTGTTVSRYATWDGRDRINGFSSTSAGGPFSGPIAYEPLDRTLRFGGISSANDRWLIYAGVEAAPTFEKSVSSGAITRTHIPGPAGDLAEYAGVPTTASTVTYHYYNGHGDLAATATQAGARVNTYAYEPFGKQAQYQTGAGKDETPATDSSLERYNGRWDKRYDTSWNIIEMGARPYDSTTGKFLSPDPVDGGSANNYDYVNQDPVNGYDLSGTAPGSPAMWAGGCKVQHCSGGSFSLTEALNLMMLVTMPWGGAEAKQARSGAELLVEAAIADSEAGEINAVGRAMQKHGSRPGSAFPEAVGSAAAINAKAEGILRDIIAHSVRRNQFYWKRGHVVVIDIFDATGRGARFTSAGKFLGFLEP